MVTIDIIRALIVLCVLALIGYAVWQLSSAWPLIALLIIPSILDAKPIDNNNE